MFLLCGGDVVVSVVGVGVGGDSGVAVVWRLKIMGYSNKCKRESDRLPVLLHQKTNRFFTVS